MNHKLLQTWARKSAKLLAAIALLATTGLPAMAKEYTVYSSDNKGTWTADNSKKPTKYTCTQTVDNVSFSMAYIKESGNKTFNEPTKYTPWRVYGKSSISIDVTGIQMTKIEITTDKDKPGSYTTTTVNEGWTTSYENLVLSFTSTGATSFKYTNTSESQVKVSKIVVTGEPISQNLGEIMYNGNEANNQTLTAINGDVFTFNADNAENMTLAVDPNAGEVSEFENGAISWTAPAVTKETSYHLTIKASKGTESKEAAVTITVDKAPLCGMPAFSTAGTITKGSSVTISCENAKQIKYWISENADDAEADAQTVDAPATVTINQNCYLHACGINADGIAGETSSVQYTVTEPTTAMFDFNNVDDIKAAYTGTPGTLEASNSTSAGDTNNLDGKSLKKNGVEVTFADDGDGTPVRWWKSSNTCDLRLYDNDTMTFTADNGLKLTSISFTVSSVNGSKMNMTANIGNDIDGTNSVWTPSSVSQSLARSAGDVTSVTFTNKVVDNNNKQTRISKIEVAFAPSTPTGIAGIEAENGEAVYFNLQGVRVQNPENGIFIRVQNGKATKIMK